MSGGKAEPLFARGESGLPLSWTRDRQYILIRRDGAKNGSDLVAVGTGGERPEVVVAQSQYDEGEGQFSPDGRWVAFGSNESGRPEVLVQSFPEGRARTQVSTAGGAQIRWSSDGKEIFYVAPDGRMMAVSIASGGASPDVKLPVPLFQTHLATGTNVLGFKPQYAVSRDGRFLLNTAIESASAPEIAGRRVSATSSRLSAIQLSRKATREIASISVRINRPSAASCGATTSATRHSPALTGPVASATACEEFDVGDGAITRTQTGPG